VRKSESIVLTTLEGGSGNPVSVYLGGTATQWMAYIDGPPVIDDTCSVAGCTSCLYDRIWHKLTLENTIGDAFNRGKIQYYSTAQPLTNPGASCDGCSYRIAHQTMLYGDPTLKLG
jgi:hypothetical protein